MMKIFVRHHAVLFILVVTTTVDASRLFYLPLPKLHPTQQQQQQQQVVASGSATEGKGDVQDDVRSSRSIKVKENTIEKRSDLLDWEKLLDQQLAAARHRLAVSEYAPKENSHHFYQQQVHQPRLRPLNEEQIKEIEETIDAAMPLMDTNVLPETPEIVDDEVTGRAERLQSNPVLTSIERKNRRNDTLFLVIVGTCCVVGVVGLVAAAIFWYKIQKRAEAAVDAEYPSYGVTGPNSSGSKMSPSSTMSDRKLAQSAQMFHYQQQRQQMMAQEKAHLDAKPVHSDDSDDEAPGGGDYTVYECPGLAPTGEMEVRNPLFSEPDSSLASSASSLNPTTNTHYPQLSTASPPKEKSLQ